MSDDPPQPSVTGEGTASAAPAPAPLVLASVSEAMASGGGVFFGERWDAPAFEDAVRVPVPVGAVCLMCTEAVEAHDSGTFTSYLSGLGDASVEAVHIECWLRSLLGCVSHLQHRCSCYGGSEHEGTTRDDARAVKAWLLDQQRA